MNTLGVIAILIHGVAAKIVIIALLAIAASLCIVAIRLLTNWTQRILARRFEREYGPGPWSQR
jgi:hypothetical protein